MEKLLFITTSSLASNPRLVKEFESLKYNYKCYVLYFVHQDWSLKLSQHIINRNPQVVFIGINRKKKFFQTVVCKVINGIAIFLNTVFPKNILICSFANSDKAIQLALTLKSLQSDNVFIKIIAHNLGAFYPATQWSKQVKAKLQLDIEDYHPGEAFISKNPYEKHNRLRIMNYCFLRADSISYASQGIQMECKKHFKIKQHSKHEVILNVFESSDFKRPTSSKSDRLQCVWFSQYVGPKRGLEEIFKSAKQLSDVDFHIIGNIREQYVKNLEFSPNIIFHEVMHQQELHDFLGKMDIGLALEDTTVDTNRNICLTNKILAYIQTGLYVTATNTYGQTQFLNSLEDRFGKIINDSLSQTLLNIDTTLLSEQAKIERWEKAKSLSWETEKLKLYKLIS